MATEHATWAYRDRFGDSFGRTYFRRYPPGVCSSIGVGTYLGDPTTDVDDRYEQSIIEALESGINVVDTAINYRCQRSERVVGRAIDRADVGRDAVVVSTKGGFLPFDGERPADPGDYLKSAYVETGLVEPEELARGSHCIAPGFIEEMLDRSMENLGLDTIDCYYVHNPETQLLERSSSAVYDTLEATFERLERRRLAGDLTKYGLATWQAFRVPRNHEQYLSLDRVLDRAETAADRVGVDEHGLTTIQLPFNVRMADAFTRNNQPLPDRDTDRPIHSDTDRRFVSTLEYAHQAGLFVVTSASIGQGELSAGLPEPIGEQLHGDTATQRAINFARSAPAVTCSLVGTSSPEHVAENVAAGTFDPLGASAFDAVFE